MTVKLTVQWLLLTAYDDGAGATANYVYLIGTKIGVIPAASIWRFRAFTMTAAKVAKAAIVAGLRYNVAGVPPAANTRTIDIATTGAVTFLDTDETLLCVCGTVSLTDVDGEVAPLLYDMNLMGLSHEKATADHMIATGCNAADAAKVRAFDPLMPVGPADAFMDATFSDDANAVAIGWRLTAAQIALGVVPTDFTFVLAEKDLVTRDYAGLTIELAGKAAITLAQVLLKNYSGLAAQAVNYITTGESPTTLNVVPLAFDVALNGGLA